MSEEDPELSMAQAIALYHLKLLTSQERIDLFGEYFCTSCGDEDPTCQCWNDE